MSVRMRVRNDPSLVTPTARRAVIGIFTTTPVQFVPNAELTDVTNFSKRIGNFIDVTLLATLVNGLGGVPLVVGTIEANPHEIDIINLDVVGTPPGLGLVLCSIGVDGLVTLIPTDPIAPGTLIQLHSTYISSNRFPISFSV